MFGGLPPEVVAVGTEEASDAAGGPYPRTSPFFLLPSTRTESSAASLLLPIPSLALPLPSTIFVDLWGKSKRPVSSSSPSNQFSQWFFIFEVIFGTRCNLGFGVDSFMMF